MSVPMTYTGPLRRRARCRFRLCSQRRWRSGRRRLSSSGRTGMQLVVPPRPVVAPLLAVTVATPASVVVGVMMAALLGQAARMMLSGQAPVVHSVSQTFRAAPLMRIQPRQPVRQRRPNATGVLVSSVVLIGGRWAGLGRKNAIP
jgi:hypothetical protein